MALDANDLVEHWMDEQARLNSAVDAGDINNLVGDIASISSERVGMQADVLGTSTTAPPHLWSDGQSPWGFVSWA